MVGDAASLWIENQRLLSAFVARTAGSRPEDWYVDAARYGFAKACCLFDPTRGSFGTVAWRFMANEVHMEWRRRRTDAIHAAASLDALLSSDGPTLMEILADARSDAAASDAETMASLTHAPTLRLVLGGMTQAEIARQFGVSQPMISRRYRRELAEWAAASGIAGP